MSLSRNFDNFEESRCRGIRSHSAQGLAPTVSSPAMKIPLPPRMWITDIEAESSDEAGSNDEGVTHERPRVRSRFRHHKAKSSIVPIGIFWDIENCQIPRGCSAIDVVAAIRAKFLNGRREADFVVVCDVRKEIAYRLQELNDAQISLIHVCGTQKNAADDKLRQCMRRFSELHNAPAALLLISGDINFAADLSDFRHRKNMEVILVHKSNTSSALIACASSHYCYNELTASLPRNGKSFSNSNDEDDLTCILVVWNLPYNQPYERIKCRLKRLADNCGGKVQRVASSIATIRFPTPIHAARALKRMDGEDVFGRKIHTRYIRGVQPPAYSSDEGYNTAPPTIPQRQPSTPLRPPSTPLTQQEPPPPPAENRAASDWALALQQLPMCTPPPLDFCPPAAPKPRKIRGTHGSVNLDRSGCSSSISGDESRLRAASPWNSSSVSEQSEAEESAELTVANLPPYEPATLQEMLTKLLSQYVPVVRVSVWAASDGPLASVVLRSEHDARLAIARVHKRRLDHQWTGRRLELSIGRPSPAPNLDILRARLRAILLDHKGHALPLLRLRDAYASRHCCALTTSDIAKVKDTVVIHEGFGRMVQLVDLTPVTAEMEEAPWKCHIHASLSMVHEDGSRILQPVFMEVAVLAQHANVLLENHGGLLPLLSFMECYEATFPALYPDPRRGVPLELLLRSAPTLEVKDSPSRHLTWRTEGPDSPPSFCSQSESSRSSGHSDRPRTAPSLEPMLALFERELIDLLRTAPKCSIPFSKLIPAFHHHFGRQCRVADYGFTKLPDLLAALGNTIVVLGSGSSRVITISCAAQGRRWTSDLVKLLKTQPGRAILMHDIPQLFQATFGRMFTPVDYGVCTLPELMERVSPQAISVAADGTISLPRRAPTEEEKARTVQFSKQTVELLCYTPNLRMEFSRFVPAYHAHFGRQLRVAHYGCVKLIDLFELISEAVSVSAEINGERAVKLSARTAKPVFAQRLRALGPVPLQTLPLSYAMQFGAPPLPDILNVSTLKELVYAAGGYIESGMVIPPGRLAGVALSACAALCGDRSVARGSTHEYFNMTFRRFTATSPDLLQLAAAGILRIEDSRVILMPAWRTVWRLAQIFADKDMPLTAMEVYLEYTNRFEPVFPSAETGLEGVTEFLRQYNEIFADTGNGRWTLCSDVVVPRVRDIPIVQEDYSVHDTPPGQKGSRVFDSPTRNIWCSPPASALPIPSALLTQEKRRTRLAAQFGAP